MTAPATGLVMGGSRVFIPGVTVRNWFDDPSLRLRMPGTGHPADGTKRRGVPRGIVLHSTHGTPGGHDQRPQRLRSGIGPASTAAEANAHYWSRSDGQAGAHIAIDFDGDVICLADLVAECAFHAGGPNDTTNHHTIGIEIVQGLHGSADHKPFTAEDYAYFYRDQLAVAVRVVDVIRQHPALRIQPMIQSPYHGSAHPVRRFAVDTDWSGVIMHRDQTSGRGAGDAGDVVLETFLAAGYEGVDYAARGDVDLWKPRQAALNLLGAQLTVDGDPGGHTAAAIEKYYGHKSGMWVER